MKPVFMGKILLWVFNGKQFVTVVVDGVMAFPP